MRLIDRYRQGHFADVWRALQGLGPRLHDQEVQEEVETIAAETMARVRVNAEILVAHLSKIGYSFSRPLHANPESLDTRQFGVVEVCDQVLSPPNPATGEQLLAAERAFGPLPSSLRSFYQHIGSIDFTGNYPGICTVVDDQSRTVNNVVISEPLQVYPLGIAIYLKGRSPQRLRRLRGNYRLFPISLEKYQRHGFSGGPHEGLVLDGALAVDAPFTADELPFVESLRLAFRWCGFPGFRHTPASFPDELEYLREKMIPF